MQAGFNVLGFFVPNTNTSTNLPKSYLIYRFYDKNDVLLRTEFHLISNIANGNWENLQFSTFEANTNGNLEVFVFNESNVNVWFDDMQIQHIPTLISQENHYYAFGMNAKEIEKEGSNKWQYNGQEKYTDFGLDWSNYKYRFYDFETTRFFGVDPIAEQYEYLTPYQFASCNPASKIEFEGLEGISLSDIWEGTKSAASATGSFLYGTSQGLAQSFSNTVEGVFNTVSDPLGTAQSVGSAIYNYDKTANAITTSFSNGFNTLVNGNAEQKGRITGEILGYAGELAFGAKGVGAVKNMIGKADDVVDLSRRVEQLHSSLNPVKQKMTATAIVEGTDKSGKTIRVVGHSDKYTPSDIKKILKKGEIATPLNIGKKDVSKGSTTYHAEQVAGEGAKQLGITPKKISVAGQKICEGCDNYIKQNNLKVVK